MTIGSVDDILDYIKLKKETLVQIEDADELYILIGFLVRLTQRICNMELDKSLGRKLKALNDEVGYSKALAFFEEDKKSAETFLRLFEEFNIYGEDAPE